jgi:hypothetical protein
MKNGSEAKIGVLDLRRVELLRHVGLKITPALREYYRYTGVSAELEKRGLAHSDDKRFPLPPPPEAPERPRR